MKILNCPLNGPRNVSEFINGGEVTEMPDPATGSDREWADYIFMDNNSKGVVREWWLHSATSYWFIAERDTATDEVLRTYPADEVFTQRLDFKSKST